MDVPVDKEPGDAEDSGSCCTKCYSDEKAFTDIPPDGVAGLFKHRQLKTLRKVMTQEVKVPVAELPPSTQAFRTRTPRCRLRKDCGGAAGADHRACSVGSSDPVPGSCQAHAVPQIPELIWQVTVLPRWCFRLMSDPTECVFVDSDTRNGWNPTTMLPGTAFHRPRQQVNNQGLLNRCWSHNTASIDSRPKTPGIMAGTVRKSSYVNDESKNRRGVSKLKYLFEHGAATV